MPAVSHRGRGRRTINEINMVPFIDVMLVLLIIFMITAPLMAHKVQIDLPESVAKPNEEPPGTITLSLKSTGETYWNDEAIVRSAIDTQLRIQARRTPQPTLQIRADLDTEYKEVATLMASAKNAGMKKVGLITTPQGS